ncbi:MAG: hypothetical protein ACJAU6_000576 [Alphaproteobacteria bacterium]|jgi:hypothetical protein
MPGVVAAIFDLPAIWPVIWNAFISIPAPSNSQTQDRAMTIIKPAINTRRSRSISLSSNIHSPSGGLSPKLT